MGGFITGICTTIILMQVPKLMGGTAGVGELFELAEHIAETLKTINLPSLVIGLTALFILLVSKKVMPKFPMAVALMAAGALMTLCWLRIVLHRKTVTRSMIIRKFLHFPWATLWRHLPDAVRSTVRCHEVQWANSIRQKHSLPALRLGYQWSFFFCVEPVLSGICRFRCWRRSWFRHCLVRRSLNLRSDCGKSAGPRVSFL